MRIGTWQHDTLYKHEASLDAPLRGHEDQTIAEVVPDATPGADARLAAARLARVIVAALEALPPLESAAVRIRFGIVDPGETSIPQERVAKLAQRALPRLRAAIASGGGTGTTAAQRRGRGAPPPATPSQLEVDAWQRLQAAQEQGRNVREMIETVRNADPLLAAVMTDLKRQLPRKPGGRREMPTAP